MANEDYRYQTRDVPGLISQIVRYVHHGGHYFYLRGLVPEHKDPHFVAEKLINRYGIRRRRWQRKRRHLKETASIHLLMRNRLWVLMLSKGKHKQFYEDHGANVLDIRRTALKVFGYSIRYTHSEIEKTWKVFVRLDAEEYRKVKLHMLACCVWDSLRDKDCMEREFRRLPYQSYSPVYQQLLSILKAVNRQRRRRGFEQISPLCIRQNRKLGTVFVEPDDEKNKAA
jgi:hypothetical protein